MPPVVSDLGYLVRFKPNLTPPYRELVFWNSATAVVEPPPLLGSILHRAAKSMPMPDQYTIVTFEIRFNYRGKTYVGEYLWNGTDVFTDDVYRLHSDQFPPKGEDPSLPKGTQPSPIGGVPYQVNAPPRRTLASRLSLPAGAYVDLMSSGFTAHKTFTNNLPLHPSVLEGSFYLGLGYVNTAPPNPPLQPAKIMFAPNGQLHRFHGEIVFPGTPADNGSNRPIGLQPPNPVRILLSNTKRGSAPSQTSTELSKSLLAEETGIWVSISPSGKVSTTPNVGFNSASINANDPSQFRFALQDARSKVRSSAEMGGR